MLRRMEISLGTMVGLALVTLVAACAYLTTQQGQTTVQTLIFDGGRALCASLNVQEKATAKDVVTQIEIGALPVDAVFANPNAQYLVFLGPAWNLLNGVLGALAPAQYSALLPVSEKSLVDGCAGALGVVVPTPVAVVAKTA